jgi:hypothetical protein
MRQKQNHVICCSPSTPFYHHQINRSVLIKIFKIVLHESFLQLPIVLLAGEAAHDTHFSTTHGAFETGEMQAKKILQHFVSAPTTMMSKY